MEPVTYYLPTWRPLWEPMNFAPMAASSKINRGDDNLSKLGSFSSKFHCGHFSGWLFME